MNLRKWQNHRSYCRAGIRFSRSRPADPTSSLAFMQCMAWAANSLQHLCRAGLAFTQGDKADPADSCLADTRPASPVSPPYTAHDASHPASQHVPDAANAQASGSGDQKWDHKSQPVDHESACLSTPDPPEQRLPWAPLLDRIAQIQARIEAEDAAEGAAWNSSGKHTRSSTRS